MKGKGGLAIILGGMKPKGMGAKDEKKGKDDDKGAGLNAAAEEIINAITSGNPKALAKSLKNFVEMCNSDDAY